MTPTYVCIHGHFYQPPRENAWLEAIESQDSAHPYHDWNGRICAECYAANAASRILDGDGYIIDIVNNYEKMSFNFGPTLLSWLAENAREVYAAVLAADKRSLARFSGHGSALAQAYNHMIMPLADHRDKTTQVHWGIADFKYRFGRDPEGMWLPETAVDLETLDILSASGIRFTLLAPGQAEAVRGKGGGGWQDVGDGSIDTTRPYRVQLPSGRTMALFFYNGALSHAVAFERLPTNGDVFYERLISEARRDTAKPRLIHICTDGETYGHHHRHGDMGLAYALHRLEKSDQVRLTNYGAFLAAHPPEEEVRIKENTSWSCVHGVERWRSDCGCNSGGNPQWHQRWRRPLREALDWLRDSLTPLYEKKLGDLLNDPWAARDDYIAVVLRRDTDAMEDFLLRHRRTVLSPAQQVTVLKLMEMARNGMLMYTSCGWFFDELSGIETVQILQYAGRALQLAQTMFPKALEPGFLEKLGEAPSNISRFGDGRWIYGQWVQTAVVSLAEVGAHYAISSLFREYDEQSRLYSYTANRRFADIREAGQAKLGVGRVSISANMTWESADFLFGVLHFGDHNISCGLCREGDAGGFQEMHQRIVSDFEQADFPAVLQQIRSFFAGPLYSMKSLFRDEQRGILEPILRSRVADAVALYRAVYEPNVPLMRYLKDGNTPPPKALVVAGELVLNHTLEQALAKEHLDHEQIRELMDQARLAGIALDETTLEFTLRQNIERQSLQFHRRPERFAHLDDLMAAVELVYALPFHVELRQVQNTHFEIGRKLRDVYRHRAERGEEAAARWLERFDQLGEKLLMRWGASGKAS